MLFELNIFLSTHTGNVCTGAGDLPWGCWVLLFEGLYVGELYSLPSTSGLENITLKTFQDTEMCTGGLKK